MATIAEHQVTNESEAAPTVRQLQEAIVAFFEAPAVQERREVVSRHPVLLTRLMQRFLVLKARGASSPELGAEIQRVRRLLADCANRGVEKAILELPPWQGFMEPLLELHRLGMQQESAFGHPNREAALLQALESRRALLNHRDFARSDPRFQLASLHSAASTAFMLHEDTGEARHLQSARKWLRRAIRICDQYDFNAAPTLLNLGICLVNLFEQSGALRLLSLSTKCFEKAIDLEGHDILERANYLTCLANNLTRRHDMLGRRGDLSRAIDVLTQAVALIPGRGAERVGPLHAMSQAFYVRYQLDGRAADLNRAIRLGRLARSGRQAGHAGHLTNVVSQLCARHAVFRRSFDLDEAKDVADIALARLAPRSSEFWRAPLGLSKVHFARFVHEGSRADIDQAVDLAEQAALSIRPDSPHRAACLRALGEALAARYVAFAEPSDLTESMRHWREALNAGRPGAPTQASLLCGLAGALRLRYEQSGAIEDLDEAISLCNLALQQRILGASERVTLLHDAAVAILLRAIHTQRQDELLRGVDLLEQAAKRCPEGSISHSTVLGDLGAALSMLGHRTRSRGYAQRSVRALARAKLLAPPNSPQLASILVNLADALALRGRPADSLRRSDLDEAIEIYRQCERLVAPHSRAHAQLLNNLGLALLTHARASDCEAEFEQALAVLSEALNLGRMVAPQVALLAGRTWIAALFDRQQWDALRQVYQRTLEVSEDLVDAQLLRHGKEAWIRASQGIAFAAAYALAQLDDKIGAVLALERGRARLLADALELRSLDLSRLTDDGHDAIRSRFEAAQARWSALAAVKEETLVAARRGPVVADTVKEARQQLTEALAAVRALPGYEDFRKPVSLAKVRRAAQESDLVYLLTTPAGGLALSASAMPEGLVVNAVALPGLTQDSLEHWLMGSAGEASAATGYLRAYRGWLAQPHNARSTAAWQEALEDTSDWLWTTVMQPVLASVRSDRPMTLIATGSLSLLPLHAAGVREAVAPKAATACAIACALDQRLIRYAPCASAIGGACIGATCEEPTLLTVTEPMPVSAEALPASHMEGQVAAGGFERVRVLSGTHATLANVKRALQEVQVVHFSCHAHASLLDPLSSGLLLANDSQLSVRDLLSMHVPSAQWAILSACETGVVGLDLPDESIGLPAALLQAGFGGVIASMWSVGDLGTAVLMAYFYHQWRGREVEPAQALREAQIWLRDSTNGEKVSFFKAFAGRQVQTPQRGIPWAVAADLVETLQGLDPQERDFAHPYHWAAFACTGNGSL